MMSFDEIWPRFSYVMEELEDGAGCFEGYITSIDETNMAAPISKIVERANRFSFMYSVWSDETNLQDWEKEYDVATYVDFFRSDRIVLLNFEFEFRSRQGDRFYRLIFEKWAARTALELLCYGNGILSSPDPKQAIADAILEFRQFRGAFQGDALFLGPCTLDYPQSPTDYPDIWMKIE